MIRIKDIREINPKIANRFERSQTECKQRMVSAMECKLDKATIYYEVIGEGKPIVMLHGWPLDHRYMQADMEPIFALRGGWKRIYPDLPGMGKTPAVDWITSHDQMLQVVMDFIDQVVHGKRFSVAGASYGGYLARGLVYRRSERMHGLLLTAPLVQPDDEKSVLPPHTSIVEDPAIYSEVAPGVAKSFRGFAVVQSKKFLDYMRANIYPAAEMADHKFLEKLGEHYFSFDVDKLPAPFTGPTLICTGR